MGKEFVTVRGEKIFVEDGTLNLRSKGITDIREIEGLDQCINLQYLDLSWNKIREIKGLEQLTDLQTLNLSRNRITEIKGMEHLTNLHTLDLNGNPLSEDDLHVAYLLDELGCLDVKRDAQDVVKYCQEKAKRQKNGS